jgi:antitoxin MazE
MLVSVIPIGNSKGIRLPKAILEQLNIQDKLDLEVEDKQLVLKPISRTPREGWEDALRQMSQNHEDTLLISDSNSSEAFEWEW